VMRVDLQVALRLHLEVEPDARAAGMIPSTKGSL